MTLEEFAGAHHLPQRWLELRKQCEDLVRSSDFWNQADLKDEARRLATQASDILANALRESPEGGKTHGG